MTKKEFYQLIESFHKKPGTYTPEEIYKIGVAHKSLDKTDKDWNKVARVIGWCGSGDSLRNHIIRLQKRDGTLQKNIYLLNDKTVFEAKGEDIVRLQEDLYKQQQKTRDEWTTYRRLLREDARIESLKDAIRNTVSQLKTLPPICYKETNSTKELTKEAILLLSDMHIGVECENFANTYNVQIAKERVDKLVNDVIDYCKENKVKILHITNLGDMIHGIIHTNARLEEEIDVVDQVMVASEIISKAVHALQKAAPIITYRSVTDNHSRAIANKNEAIEKENFNRLIDWYVEERLSHTNVHFMHDNLDEGIGRFVLQNGKKVVFAHGHRDGINTVFDHFVGATQEFVDYVLLGHYHSEKIKSYQRMRVIVNGSIVGTEQYALGQRLFGSPSQTLLIFDRDNLINISVNLENTKKEHNLTLDDLIRETLLDGVVESDSFINRDAKESDRNF